MDGGGPRDRTNDTLCWPLSGVKLETIIGQISVESDPGQL